MAIGRRPFADFAASALLAASALVATPASAQTGSGADDPEEPVYCSYTPQGGWFCCRIYDPCQQIYYDSPVEDRRPEEPVEPSESPKG